ncbi:hypothetical protein LTS17_002760 [Exophiala oligosperma]
MAGPARATGGRRLCNCITLIAVSVTTLLLFRPIVTFVLPLNIDNPLPTTTTVIPSGFNWTSLIPHNPPKSITPLPSGKFHSFAVQHEFEPESPSDSSKRLSRRTAVKSAFDKCWKNYKAHAWLRDELEPLSGSGKDTYGGWAATLVDSLDTLWIMDLQSDFREAVKAVSVLDWANTTGTACNMFETNIRYLGGLLAAFDLSQEPVLLAKAVELGDMLYAGFDTPNRIPPFWLNFEQAKQGSLIAETHQISASVGSFSLEFTRLSQITGDPKYYSAVAHLTSVFEESQNSTAMPGMWPTFIDARNARFDENSFTLGALADSLYEYLPKMYSLVGGQEKIYQKMYLDAMDAVKKHLLFRPTTPDNKDILFSGSATVSQGVVTLGHEGQHLSCFAGGMFILGGKLFSRPDHLDIGAKLTHGCAYAYEAFPTGIMPEIFDMMHCASLDGCEWDEQRWQNQGNLDLPRGFARVQSPSYILRPEAIESIFILYRTTGDKTLQDLAWRMFQSIQKATETRYGNAGIEDVNAVNGKIQQKNSMESFWLAETLKYFYLIFSESDLINLDDYVLNTEAHPLRRPVPHYSSRISYS